MAGDHRVEHRHLLDRIELGRALENEVRAERLGGRVGAFAHGDVEGIGGEAGNQRDGEALGLGFGAAGRAGEQRPHANGRDDEC